MMIAPIRAVTASAISFPLPLGGASRCRAPGGIGSPIAYIIARRRQAHHPFCKQLRSGLWRRAEIVLEEGDGAAPGQIRGRLVISVAAGVVIEGVIDVRVDVNLEALARGLERGLIGRDT